MLNLRHKCFRLGLRRFSISVMSKTSSAPPGNSKKTEPWTDSTFPLDTSFGEVQIEWGQHLYRQWNLSLEKSHNLSLFHYRGRSGSPPLLVLPAFEFSYKICSSLPDHLPHDFCSRCFGVNFSFQIPEAQTIRLYGVNLPNRRQSEIWKGAPTLDDYSNLLRKTLQVAKPVQKIQTKCSRKLRLRDTVEPTFWLTPWAPTLQ